MMIKTLINWLRGRLPCEQDCACPKCGMDYFKRLIGCVVVCLGCGKVYRTS